MSFSSTKEAISDYMTRLDELIVIASAEQMYPDAEIKNQDKLKRLPTESVDEFRIRIHTMFRRADYKRRILKRVQTVALYAVCVIGAVIIAGAIAYAGFALLDS